jgi:hypothetical protein
MVLVRWGNVSLVEPVGGAQQLGQGHWLFYTQRLEEPRQPIHEYTLPAFESMQTVAEIEAGVRSKIRFSLVRSPSKESHCEARTKKEHRPEGHT